MAINRSYVDLDFSKQKLTNYLSNPLTTTQRTALALTATDVGFVVYDTTELRGYTWSGSAWLGAAPLPDANGITMVSGTGVFSNTTSKNVSHVLGNLGTIPANGTTNTFFGYAGIVNTGSGNTFIGSFNGLANTSGVSNTFVGANAGLNNTTGTNNTFIGIDAGKANITGTFNTFIGDRAGAACTGVENSMFGTAAGYKTTTGGYNVFFGELAGASNTTGNQNTYIGTNAANSNVTGINNVVIGANANDTLATSSSGCTLIGMGIAGYGNISNTVIISDGANKKNIIADVNSARFTAPVRPPQFTVALLPSAASAGVGAIAYATNGRKSAEAAAAGTGCPVFSNGTIWLCFYNNLQVTG